MIKTLTPDMPTTDELVPWLRKLDEAKVFVNNGPMVQLLERELQALVVNSPCTVVSNGTLAIELALRAMDLRAGAGVLVPAVTYVATGQAIVNAGLRPILCDVDPQTWQLPADLAETLVGCDTSIAAVIPVAAFGAPVPIGDWERFSLLTGLGVLVDAAGAILDQAPSSNRSVAIAYSLHATKALGAGEGGVVASVNAALIAKVRDLANFGAGGTNAKLSEYHAAAALASLGRRSSWRARVNHWYAARLPRGVRLQGGAFQTHRTLLPILLPPDAPFASLVQASLLDAGIETKLWYRPFLDERTQFFGCAKFGPMPTTEMLRRHLLGLPYHAFLTEIEVDQVCNTLAKVIA